MYDYSVCPHYDILCIDLKSFFASVSCRLKGLDPKTTKLAVVGDTKSIGSVVLAATPELKKLGIKTGSRLFEIPARSDIYIIMLTALLSYHCVVAFDTTQIAPLVTT